MFSTPLTNANDFPPAKVLTAPTIRVKGDCSKPQRNQPYAFALDHARSGLYLLATTMREKRVWLPSYHCPALVEPFMAGGKTVAFYPVKENLAPSIDSLQHELMSGDAVVGVRFFGFEQDTQELALLCKKHKCYFIEDLAHCAFFDTLYGDAAVTSLVKFFPVKRGSELIFQTDDDYFTSVQVLYKQLPSPLTEQYTNLLRKLFLRLWKYPNAKRYRYFDRSMISRNISKKDLQIIQYTNSKNISAKRKQVFQQLLEAFGNNHYGKPLYQDLPEGITPYVFPFLLHTESDFPRIRQQGIQVYRWEELAESGCAVSLDYRQRLIQIPCHQDLSHHDLQLITSTLKE